MVRATRRVSRRHDRPNAVLWLLRNHPELKTSQLMRLVGTTKPTIAQIKDRTHWNSANLVPQDPVTLGLCSQVDLDNEVKRAARRMERERREANKEAIKAGTLLPTEETTAPADYDNDGDDDDGAFRPTAEIMQPKEAPEAREETPRRGRSPHVCEAQRDEGRAGRGRRGRQRQPLIRPSSP